MKKGISLVVLILTIIIMVILAGIVVVNATGMFVDMELTKLKIDIAQLESLMNTYKIRVDGNINFPKTQLDLSKLSSDELLQFKGENIANNKVELYVIDLEDIDAEAVNFGNLKDGVSDRYLYSIITGRVYYELGLESDGIRYYHIKNGE